MAAFLGGLIGFAFAKLAIAGVHGTSGGIVLAAVIYSVLSKLADLVLTHSSLEENDWFDPGLLWLFTAIVSFVLLVPVSAVIAPEYAVSGVLANLGAIVSVYVGETLVSRASPWGGIPAELREKLGSRHD